MNLTPSSKETFPPNWIFIRFGTIKEITIPARSVVTLVYDLENPTTIQPVENTSFKIYPNPVRVSEDLNIKLPEIVNGNATFSVYSTLGNLLYIEKQIVSGSDVRISLPFFLNKGTYILKMQSDIFNGQSAFIIQ